MDRSDKEKLTRNLSTLAAKTRWNERLQAALLEHKVFSQKLMETILSKPEGDRSQQLFLDVQKRGPRAFSGLVRCLVESGNGEAARVLDPSVVATAETRERPASLAYQSRNKKVWNEPTYDPIPSPTSGLRMEGEEEEEGGIELTDDRAPIEVNVRMATNWKGPPQYKAYPMRRKRRGLALIVDNEEFQNDVLPKREGSRLDANNLDILFEQLGFKTIVRRNLKYQDMTRELNAFSALSEHADSDMCVVCLLSHGNSGLVFSTDGREVSTEWVLRKFNNEGCPALKGKPKFVLLQACRGDEPDYGYVPRLDTPVDDGSTATDAKGVAPAKRRQFQAKDPTWEDMLIAYATVPGYVANRNLYRGTWFVESICHVFMNMAWERDIRDMLDEVSDRMRYYESETGTKQSCSYEVRHFYKKLFFNPGIVREEEGGDPDRGEKSKLNTAGSWSLGVGQDAAAAVGKSVTMAELADSVDGRLRIGPPGGAAGRTMGSKRY